MISGHREDERHNAGKRGSGLNPVEHIPEHVHVKQEIRDGFRHDDEQEQRYPPWTGRAHLPQKI